MMCLFILHMHNLKENTLVINLKSCSVIKVFMIWTFLPLIYIHQAFEMVWNLHLEFLAALLTLLCRLLLTSLKIPLCQASLQSNGLGRFCFGGLSKVECRRE